MMTIKKDEMAYEDDLNQALLKDFLWIQELGKEEKLSWDSSLTDLCIWIHQVFLQFAVTDKHGRPRAYKSLIQEICHLTNRKIPENPNSYVNSAPKKDSAWNKCFMTRYKDIFLSGEMHPILHFISRRRCWPLSRSGVSPCLWRFSFRRRPLQRFSRNLHGLNEGQKTQGFYQKDLIDTMRNASLRRYSRFIKFTGALWHNPTIQKNMKNTGYLHNPVSLSTYWRSISYQGALRSPSFGKGVLPIHPVQSKGVLFRRNQKTSRRQNDGVILSISWGQSVPDSSPIK